MMYIPALLIAWALGYFAFRKLAPKFNDILSLLFGLALGLGIVAHIGFYVHIVLNQFHFWLTPAIAIIIIFLIKPKTWTFPEKAGPVLTFGWVLAGLAGLLIVEALHYPLGGWDAWSCWNLKAKFIYFGQEDWKNVLLPELWRSNTHYPLLLPLINVWFWQWCGAQDFVPMLNAVLLSLLTAGILFFGLCRLQVKPLYAAGATLLGFAFPFGITLSISQYSDVLIALYTLCAFSLLIIAERENLPSLKIPAVIFMGLLSFTKTEGLVAAGILLTLHVWMETKDKRQWGKWLMAFCFAALPTIIFMLFIAPKNEAFINGLLSSDKPSDFNRLMTIAVYPFMEFINMKWNGLWILIIGAVFVSGKNAWQGRLKMIGLFILGYLSIVLAYYFVNTFFPILWWLQTTFDRIIYALVPTLLFWLTLSLQKK